MLVEGPSHAAAATVPRNGPAADHRWSVFERPTHRPRKDAAMHPGPARAKAPAGPPLIGPGPCPLAARHSDMCCESRHVPGPAGAREPAGRFWHGVRARRHDGARAATGQTMAADCEGTATGAWLDCSHRQVARHIPDGASTSSSSWINGWMDGMACPAPPQQSWQPVSAGMHLHCIVCTICTGPWGLS